MLQSFWQAAWIKDNACAICSFSWTVSLIKNKSNKRQWKISTHSVEKHHPSSVCLPEQNLIKLNTVSTLLRQLSLPCNVEIPFENKCTAHLHIHTKTQSLCMNTEPHCWHSFTSRCKWVDLKFSLCVLCLATLMLYLCWGLFSLQRKNLCLNGSALKVAPTAFNGLQTRLDPWLPSVPILCIQMERNQPVWQSFCFDTEWVQSLHIGRFGIERSEPKKRKSLMLTLVLWNGIQ